MVKALLDYEHASEIRDRLAGEYKGRGGFNLSTNARLVTGEVYNRKLENGVPEDFETRAAAIAVDIASAELGYVNEGLSLEDRLRLVEENASRFMELYASNRFRANTPTNINMGRWHPSYNEDGNITGYELNSQMGSACFVIPVDDTFGPDADNLGSGIIAAWVKQQHLHKGGGGTGFSFAGLRPKGSIIGYNPVVDGMRSVTWDTQRGTSSGYESFMNFFFNQATDAVKQGNTRRGANMGIQRIDHADFLDHIYAKFGRDKERREYRMKNFNLSVAVTDEFMEAAERNGTYTLYNPHRANPDIKRVLENKWGVENPELVRGDDLATQEQFSEIMRKNARNERNPVTTPSMYLSEDGRDVINAYTGDTIGHVINGIVHIEAAKVLRIISELSHSNGEPGVLFIDRINEQNPVLSIEEIEATNPCGEQPLLGDEACNLGSINVDKFVRYEIFDNRDALRVAAAARSQSRDSALELALEDRFTKVEERRDGKIGIMYFDWNFLDETINDAVRFLDNVIDRSDFPSESIREKVKATRKIGLGFMGFWDANVLMKIRYGSDDSLEFGEALAKRLHDKTNEASVKLAEKRGVFPWWDRSFYNPESEGHKWLLSEPREIRDKYRGKRRLSDEVDRHRLMNYDLHIRNSYTTTQAPTGTIRRTAGERRVINNETLDNLGRASSIEPAFTLWEESNIMNQTVHDFSLAAVELLQREGLWSSEMMEAIKSNRGSVFVYSYTDKEVAKVLNTIPEDVRKVLVTSAGGEKDRYEIQPSQHVDMALRFQRWNRSAISKSINAPTDATVDQLSDVWVRLWKGGSKGGTVYRDKSREFQILNTVTQTIEVPNGSNKKRPLIQRAVVVETPYIGSERNRTERGVELDPNPDSCFTTIAFNPINGRVTGVFQNVAESSVESLSRITSHNISLSGRLKGGKDLSAVIGELEKSTIRGAVRGTMTDEAVMPEGDKSRMRFTIDGATTNESLLTAFYVARFLTDDGKDLNEKSIREKSDLYFQGKVTLRQIIGSKGRITLEDSEENGRPSILGKVRKLKLPDELTEKKCVEC